MSLAWLLLPITIIIALIDPSLGERLPRSNGNCSDWRSSIDRDGSVLFIAGDRSLIIPKTSPEATIFCNKVTSSVENIRSVSRACLKPFPKQVLGLLVYGARKQIKRICGNENEKMKIVNYCACLQNATTLNGVHDTMDEAIQIFEHVRDHVPDVNKHMPYSCCYYQELKQVIIIWPPNEIFQILHFLDFTQ